MQGSSVFRFFDDPVSKFANWLTNMEQSQMRTAISEKYKGALSPQVYWIVGTDDDKQGLSTDPVEQTVQRLTLSQAGTFVAHRLWSKRNWLILPIVTLLGLCLTWMMLVKSPESSSEFFFPAMAAFTAWLSVLLFFGATFFAPLVAQFFLPSTPVRQEEIDTIEAMIRRCVVRDLPANAPADLADRLRLLTVDAEGRSTAGQVLASDLEFSAMRAEWQKTKTILRLASMAVAVPALALSAPWLGVLCYVALRGLYEAESAADMDPGQLAQRQSLWSRIFHFGVVPCGLWFALAGGSKLGPVDLFAPVQWAIWAVVFVMWGLVWWFALRSPSPLSMRALMLDQAVRESGTELLIDKAGQAHFASLEAARAKQLELATRDGSPFIELGRSTGLLAQRRDPLAPTEAGLPVGLSVSDLATHLLVLGASGTGKTSGVIRPVTHGWIHADCGGLLVIDGKGALPLELQGIGADYRLITPTGTPFNPIEGMKPDSVADTLADVFSGNADDPFWSDAARLMLRMAAMLIAEHPDLPFTIGALQRFCVMDTQARLELLAPLAESMEQDKVIQSAAHYWLAEVPAMPEKTLGSIVNMVRTWLGNITLHRVLGAWTDNPNSSVRIEETFTGAKLGLLLPESEYGKGGVAISALCMRRLYDAAKERGDKWAKQPGQKAVLLAADEVQNLLTRSDLETVPVARSLGLYLMMATQNVDGLYKRLDKDGAVQMLGNFASVVALPPRTDDSNAYVAKRAGHVWRSVVNMFHGLPDAQADLQLYNESGVNRTMQSSTLYRQSRVGAPRLSYAIGLWHRSWLPKAWHSLQDMSMADDAHAAQQQRPTLSMDVQPLLNPDELDTLLARPHSAIALLNRGRVQRRDVIALGVL